MTPASILLVEDEFLVAAFLARALRMHGYEVVGPHATVAAALEAIADPNVTLQGAVLDLALKAGETSIPIAAALAEREIPFTFLTGDDTLLQNMAALPGGSPPVMIKPVSLARLIKRVESFAAPVMRH
ncbi:MAG: response regulator [Pseudooceanicola sp.]|nr:response regulator [Pseudooceanicola sp.]